MTKKTKKANPLMAQARTHVGKRWKYNGENTTIAHNKLARRMERARLMRTVPRETFPNLKRRTGIDVSLAKMRLERLHEVDAISDNSHERARFYEQWLIDRREKRRSLARLARR